MTAASPSIVPLYAVPQWGDAEQLQEFLSLHDMEHREINQALAQQLGISLDQPMLDRPPDHDWFAQHWLLHKAVNQVLNLPSMPGLGSEWPNERAWNDWHTNNSNDHTAMSQALGIE